MTFSSPLHDLFLSHTLVLDQSNAPSVLFVFLWQWKKRKKQKKKKKTDAMSWGKVCTLRLNSEPPRQLVSAFEVPPLIFGSYGRFANLTCSVTLSPDHWQHCDTEVTASQGKRDRQWNRNTAEGGMCGEIPQTDGECMIDEPWKAINFILGAVLDRLELAPLHYSHKPYV